MIEHSSSVVVRVVESGVCELTNQNRLGILEGGSLKRQELKTECFRQRWQGCTTGQCEESVSNSK